MAYITLKFHYLQIQRPRNYIVYNIHLRLRSHTAHENAHIKRVSGITARVDSLTRHVLGHIHAVRRLRQFLLLVHCFIDDLTFHLHVT